MKLYTITHNVDTRSLTFHIVSEDLQAAVEKSCVLLLDYVYDEYRQDALDSKYLVNIDSMSVYVAKT